jgi:hypothetical protein
LQTGKFSLMILVKIRHDYTENIVLFKTKRFYFYFSLLYFNTALSAANLSINVRVVYMGRYKVVLRGDYP